MKGSFKRLGWSCANDFTMSFIFSSNDSSLQTMIFIRANPLLLLVVVERWVVLISLNLRSLSQDVIGKVKSRTCKLGNCNSLYECNSSTNFLGMSELAECCCFHFVAHMLYSVGNITGDGKSSLYRSAA